MANKGAFLTTDKFLATDDYLSSPNNLFFAKMQNDGNFVVYRGSDPSNDCGVVWATDKLDPFGQFFAKMQNDGNFVVYKGTSPNDHGVVWSTDKLDPFGQFFAAIQDDGSFGIYKGTDPDNNYGAIWVTNKSDPVKDIEVSEIKYNLHCDCVKVLRSQIEELYSQTLHNSSDLVQTTTISGSESVLEQSSWSNSLEIGDSWESGVKIGIPEVIGFETKISIQRKTTKVKGGSYSEKKTWSFSFPMKVPPHRSLTAFVSIHSSTILVPYTLEGIVILESGIRMPGKIKGIYRGTNSHGLEATYIKDQVDSKELCLIKEAITSS
jgi:hypothetical protein